MPMQFDTWHERAREYGGGPPNLHTMFLKMPDPVAGFAMRLLEAPGALLMGRPDGEDSAGRAKIGEKSVEEIVARAFDIAEAAYSEAEKRNLLVDMPTFGEIEDFAKSRIDKN